MNEALARLMTLRAELFAAIKKQLARDGHCKSYEGAFAIRLPNYFEQDEAAWQITLDCYVIGPSRHYEWNGQTLAEAITRAEAGVRSWIAQEADENEIPH